MKNIELTKILVTHDGSECASAIIPYVKSLGKTLRAKIILLRVIGPFIPEFGYGGTPDIGPLISSITYGITSSELAKEVKKTATKELETIKKELDKAGLKDIKVIVLEGYAPDIIQYIAKKEKISLIMMATHGMTGLRKTLLGSVTEQTINSSTCPVMTIRPIKDHKRKVLEK